MNDGAGQGQVIRVIGQIDLPCSIDMAWNHLRDFANSPRSVPGVGEIVVTGSGIGMVRRVPFEHSWTDEKLELMDHATHRFAYTMPACSGDVDYTDYRCEVQLTAIDANCCHYRRVGTCRARPGATAEQIRAALTRAYGISMRALAELMRQRASG